MSDDKNPLEEAVEQALDAFVYAPIGLIFDGPALFPKLVEKGRTQVKVARMMGEMAVKMGQSEAEKRVARTQEQLREIFAMGGPGANGSAATSATTAATETPAPKTAAPKASAAPAGPKPPVDELVIPDYDSLSASQVVTRLRGLAPSDLDALKAYEAATRARKTILNKIAQLQKS